MNPRSFSLVCVLPLAVGLGVGVPADAPPPPAADADRLVQQLGSSKYTERESAFKKLDELGPAALPTLRRAAQADNAEVRRRVGELIARH